MESMEGSWGPHGAWVKTTRAGSLKGVLQVKPWFHETLFQRLCTKMHLIRV